MYDSDFSDNERLLIEHHFQANDNRGAVPTNAKRDVFDAIAYINKTGSQ